MPDSYGKRQRNTNKAKKANAREERLIARNKRRAGTDDAGTESWLGDPPTPVSEIPPRTPAPRQDSEDK